MCATGFLVQKSCCTHGGEWSWMVVMSCEVLF